MNDPSNYAPVLNAAWQRHAEYDFNASKITKRNLRLRRLIAILGVLATFLAIITDVYSENWSVPAAGALKILLILVPVGTSALAAFTTRNYGDGRWLAMRAGAEQIKKEIYLYRTVMHEHPERNQWLSKRISTIQRQVFKRSNNKLDTDPYKGSVPPYYYPDDPNSDPGFHDVDPDEYIRFRLEDQLKWHTKKLVQIRQDNLKLYVSILMAGGAGALFAGLGGGFAVWVAFTAAITAALTGWEELRSYETTIANYSKVKLELTIIRDHWYSLEIDQQGQSAFYRLVQTTENILWIQNAEYIRAMQEALASSQDEDDLMIEEMVKKSEAAAADFERNLLAETQAVLDQATEQLDGVLEDAGDTVDGLMTGVVDDTWEAGVDEFGEMTDTFEGAADGYIEEAGVIHEIAADSVDGVVDEVGVYRETAGEFVETAVDEAGAYQEMASDTMDTISDQSAEIYEEVSEAVEFDPSTFSYPSETEIGEEAPISYPSETEIGEEAPISYPSETEIGEETPMSYPSDDDLRDVVQETMHEEG